MYSWGEGNAFFSLEATGLQNATDIVQDQLYLFAEQVHRLKTLERYGVEYAVCDSPLPLNIIYNNTPDELFDQLVMHEHAKFDNVDYLLRRNDEFISIGRRTGDSYGLWR